MANTGPDGKYGTLYFSYSYKSSNEELPRIHNEGVISYDHEAFLKWAAYEEHEEFKSTDVMDYMNKHRVSSLAYTLFGYDRYDFRIEKVHE